KEEIEEELLLGGEVGGVLDVAPFAVGEADFDLLARWGRTGWGGGSGIYGRNGSYGRDGELLRASHGWGGLLRCCNRARVMRSRRPPCSRKSFSKRRSCWSIR